MAYSTPAAPADSKAAAVRTMFSGIAGHYDLLNHVLSANVDKRWRRRVRVMLAEILARPDAVVADVACGTGDLAIELRRSAAGRVVGIDFCRPMLAVAAPKAAAEKLAIPWVEGDGMRLPFGDSTFDVVSIGFGLRNFASVTDGLRELLRVTRPQGKVVILEFSSPVVPGFRQVFDFYFNRILPGIGGLVSGDRSAYEYLPGSVAKFPDQNELAAMMRSSGFENVGYENLTGGIAAIHFGTRS